MRCSRCRKSVKQKETYAHHGQSLCEDCYMDVLSPPKGCDPWAVHSAQTYLEGKGKTAELTDLQQRIIQFVKEKGKATAEEMAVAMEVSEEQLIREFATLRHMEIIRGLREKGGKYYTLFQDQGKGHTSDE